MMEIQLTLITSPFYAFANDVSILYDVFSNEIYSFFPFYSREIRVIQNKAKIGQILCLDIKILVS